MIFVFGSNELGIHGRGAARYALDHEGAVMHQGFGPQGNSFAIPTCSKPAYGGHEISRDKFHYYVDCFLYHSFLNPDVEFKVTRAGCGLAGWEDELVAEMFHIAGDNCYFDERWKLYLPSKKFWGTF